jgi:hypothetical protein
LKKKITKIGLMEWLKVYALSSNPSTFTWAVFEPRSSSEIVKTVAFHLSCHQGASPRQLRELILPDTNGQLDPEEGLFLPVSQGEGLRPTTEPSEAQEPARGT